VDARDARYLTPDASASGRFESQGRVSGPLTALKVEAQTEGRGLSASGWTVDRLRANVSHDVASGRTRFESLVNVLGGQVQAQGERVGAGLTAHVELVDLQI